MSDENKSGLEFSLSCSECDAGGEFDTQTDAESAGWIDIGDDAEGLSWNQLGLCPDCQMSNAMLVIRQVLNGVKLAYSPDQKAYHEYWPILTEAARRPACIRDDLESATDEVCQAATNLVKLHEFRRRKPLVSQEAFTAGARKFEEIQRAVEEEQV